MVQVPLPSPASVGTLGRGTPSAQPRCQPSLLPLGLSCAISPCLPWDVGSATRSTHTPYIDSGTIKEREGVAANWYLAPKETFPQPPPALSIQGVGFGAVWD